MEGSVANNQRPFHETIVEAINQLPGDARNDEILRLFQHIMRTKIPENHDAICISLERFGIRSEIAHNVVTEMESLRELMQKRNEIRVDYRRTLDSVRAQKPREVSQESMKRLTSVATEMLLSKKHVPEVSGDNNPGTLGDIKLTEEEKKIFTPEFVKESIDRAMEAVQSLNVPKLRE